ncbi:hypothetical protein [Thermosynechococcus sp. M55_K2018_012]|uniref:hypothetical protein n=1 Tax=Thermosynechococcus sp. M55_K2018_012 TaxID=2747809 RepID=UPI001A0EAABE|nr:hypothetical protein [Thermosynechococcus sp. M55_K2018_012]HIK48768.1 hypothetical protein [Thermosynechococcus sp. M55_K2018_012]
MLVILTQNQILPSQSVCQSCLFADRQGQPRWHEGQLRCGAPLGSTAEAGCQHFRCQMGFHLVAVSDVPTPLEQDY